MTADSFNIYRRHSAAVSIVRIGAVSATGKVVERKGPKEMLGVVSVLTGRKGAATFGR
jgi:hypothetical protein